MSFLGEIKRRKVFKVAAVYAVVGWLIIQVVGQIAAPLGLPPWFEAFVIVLLGIGFPIALILGWIFDLTPEGLRSTPVQATEAVRVSPGQSFTYVVQGLVLVAVGFLVVDQYLLGGSSEVSGSTSSSPAQVNRFVHTITADRAVSNSRWNTFTFAPNGRRFAYQSEVGIYVRDLETLETRLVEGSQDIFANPFFSPDGQ